MNVTAMASGKPTASAPRTTEGRGRDAAGSRTAQAGQRPELRPHHRPTIGIGESSMIPTAPISRAP